MSSAPLRPSVDVAPEVAPVARLLPGTVTVHEPASSHRVQGQPLEADVAARLTAADGTLSAVLEVATSTYLDGQRCLPQLRRWLGARLVTGSAVTVLTTHVVGAGADGSRLFVRVTARLQG